ncbi:predicted protein [Uncinocarpus reesii 1704]|uniref:Uncharacterized protein n=1 Tax=Uncinocarpus reesii (strain UAMH 1704) TaxID=336963 RepID=C4JP65_UNCRE|nr:uncharacterized protein UREG_03124 [Uncinocarpus reesii 1704]EEP78279.1 predicted protein [Uncinocarpus reesii 1704]
MPSSSAARVEIPSLQKLRPSTPFNAATTHRDLLQRLSQESRPAPPLRPNLPSVAFRAARCAGLKPHESHKLLAEPQSTSHRPSSRLGCQAWAWPITTRHTRAGWAYISADADCGSVSAFLDSGAKPRPRPANHGPAILPAGPFPNGQQAASWSRFPDQSRTACNQKRERGLSHWRKARPVPRHLLDRGDIAYKERGGSASWTLSRVPALSHLITLVLTLRQVLRQMASLHGAIWMLISSFADECSPC